MSNLAQWSALVGFLLPLVIAVIQRPSFSRPVRTIIGVVFSVGAAILTALIEGNLSINSWATSLIFVAMAAYTSYTHVWVPVGAAPYVEKVTSPTT